MPGHGRLFTNAIGGHEKGRREAEGVKDGKRQFDKRQGFGIQGDQHRPLRDLARKVHKVEQLVRSDGGEAAIFQPAHLLFEGGAVELAG